MTALPAPLTPPDCDLQDFKFMPLDVQRLRDSDLVAEQTPEENWAALLLWAAGWHQVPAASLPNNDQTIAKFAGYVARGKVDKQWPSVRAGAMRGWVLCSDDRYYHTVVAEKATEAWQSKLKHAYDKLADRTRKANKARAAEGLGALQIPPFEWWISAGKPAEFPAEGAGVPAENGLKGEGQGQGEGQGSRKEDTRSPAAPTPCPSPAASPAPSPSAAPSPSPPPPDRQPWMTAEQLVGQGLTEETAVGWLAHRKTLKAKLTALAWLGFKREADKAGWSYEDAVLKAIARNWVGFEAKWVKDDPRPGKRAAATTETPFQQRHREAVHEWTGGLLSPKDPKTHQENDDAPARLTAG